MGFLDYLDKKHFTKEVKSEYIDESVDEDIEEDSDSKYVITDLGGTITFNEDYVIKRYVVWENSQMIDACNDLDVLLEKYGDVDILSREKKSNKFKIKEKVVKTVKKNPQQSEESTNEATDILGRSSLILEGLPEDNEEDPLNNQYINDDTTNNNNETEFRRPQDVSNHASKLL